MTSKAKVVGKSSRFQQRFISEPVAVMERQRPSREELRYAFKRVREITGVRRPMRPQRLAEVYSLIEEAAKCSSKHGCLLIA